ncbi:MAG TPA: DUF2207 domain-containing protein [Propionibacteriaceae bacterium]|nr:DUF2207 domain-containing protein [Propionibacteriaceae bacterium]
MRHLSRRLAAVLLLVCSLFMVALPARAAGASSYVVDAALGADGVLTVSATVTFDGQAPDTVTQRLAGHLDGDGDVRYVYDISNVKATAAGKDLQPATSVEDGYTVIRIPTKGVTGPLVISYQVRGTTLSVADGGTKLQWRVLQGLSIPVTEVKGEIKAPAGARDYGCQSGPPAAPTTCATYSGGTHDSPNLSFTDGPRGAGEVVSVAINYPKGIVAATENVIHVWSLDRAFSPGLKELLAALAALVLGGLALYAMHRRAGRDMTGDGTPTLVGEFNPVGAGESEFVINGDVRPGHVGTVADEHVDQVDVLGSILDLAVRGHLRITQLPRETEHSFTDWSLTRREASSTLAPFEKTLLDAIAPSSGEGTRVSQLAASVVPAVGAVQDDLYDEVVSRGWFSVRPDQTRNSWRRWGWIAFAVAVVAAALLVAFTTFGLLGLALVALALGLLFVAQEMPARTASGASLLSGLRALSISLDTHPTNQLPKGREYEQISQILPYAVVLGGWERWLDALVAADGDADADPEDLDWYHAPADWHLSDLPASLDAFVTAVRGRLFAR